jgi:lipopolysaccharide transport system permease protein
VKRFQISPFEMVLSLWRNRGLIAVSTKREIQGRYKATILGSFWAFVQPILMLTIYTFVFSVVFKSKWGIMNESKSEFALILFAGLIVFGLVAECVGRASSLVVSNSNYVKKVVFPLEVLPAVVLGAALFHALIALVAWFLARWVFVAAPEWTSVFLPIIWLPMCLYLLGVMWFLSSIGVYLRDIGYVVAMIVTALMFVSPIFYPVSAVPTEYRYIVYANPLTSAIEMTREVLHWGRPPLFRTLVASYFAASIVSWLGFVFFQKTRKGFADVL